MCCHRIFLLFDSDADEAILSEDGFETVVFLGHGLALFALDF